MNWALLSLAAPLITALLMLMTRARSGAWVVGASLLSLAAAVAAGREVSEQGTLALALGGWGSPLGIRFELDGLGVLMLSFTALVHLLVALYALRNSRSTSTDVHYWPLTCLLHASLAALWLSRDLFNWYVTLELLGLVAVGLILLAGPKAHAAALRYLLLSLAASVCYLLGVAMLYGQYGVLDVRALAGLIEGNSTTHTALVFMSLGLMLKGALWPLHLWLPAAHASAPTAVSALLSGVVIKGPLFILVIVWTQIAPEPIAVSAGLAFAVAGVTASLAGGWAALRAPRIKTLVAYSTISQLGYCLMALGLLLYWQEQEFHVALWLFVISHGLAKVSMFLSAGEMQTTLDSKRIETLRGVTQTMPIAMFAFAVAGGSLIGLPPSGGFVAKWVLLGPLLTEPAHWIWAVMVLVGTLVSAAYVFRIVAISFNHVEPAPPVRTPDRLAHCLALLPALLAWALANVSEAMLVWLTQVSS